MKPRALLHDVAGEGDPLVFVPGGLTGWVSWIPHQERLSDHHRAIRVQPIHNELGSAGKVGDPGYTREVERESLRLTLDELGIDRADFAGWSAGGKALLEFTLTHPDRVRTLTLVEPGAVWVLEELGERDPKLDAVNEFAFALAGQEVTEDHLAEFLASAGLTSNPAEARSHPAWGHWVPHRQTLSWITEELLASAYALEHLASITCPILLTKGTTTQPWEQRVVDVLGDRVPNARVVEFEGDHAHHIQSIDEFIDEFDDHLHRDVHDRNPPDQEVRSGHRPSDRH